MKRVAPGGIRRRSADIRRAKSRVNGQRVGLAGAALLLVTLAGCGGAALRWEPGVHVVREGETLYAIAWRYDLDHETLAAWNGLGDGSVIFPGQRLRLEPPASGSGQVSGTGPTRAPQATPQPAPSRTVPVAKQHSDAALPTWQWPARGPLLASYGSPGASGKGVDIGGKSGDPVYAASEGKVVYSGSGLIGYGQLIIIKHNNTFLSAYGHNSALLVEEGDAVTAGQRIARMGKGPGQKPLLHFEIRRNGTPVDPLKFLPRP